MAFGFLGAAEACGVLESEILFAHFCNASAVVIFPKIEANYKRVLGAGCIKPFAGFQYYTVNSGAPTQNVQDDIDLYS